MKGRRGAWGRLRAGGMEESQRKLERGCLAGMVRGLLHHHCHRHC